MFFNIFELFNITHDLLLNIYLQIFCYFDKSRLIFKEFTNSSSLFAFTAM